MENVIDDNTTELIEKKKELIIQNKFLENKLSLYKKYVQITKDIMTKFPFDNKDLALKLFNSYIEVINNDYNNLKGIYDKTVENKYKSLYDECTSDITMGKPVLYQKRNEEFYLDYCGQEKEDLITGLKKSLKQSKEFHLFREPKRDILIDMKKGNKEIEKTVTELQQNMLYECKKCNKFIEKKKKYKYQMEQIKKNIKILEKFIKDNKDNDKKILMPPPKENKVKKEKEEKEDEEEYIIENGMGKESMKENGMENGIKFENGMKKENKKENGMEKEKEKEKKSEKENGITNKYLYGKIDFKQSINIGLNPKFRKNFIKGKEKNDSEEKRRNSIREEKNKKKHGNMNIKSSYREKKNKIISEFEKVEDLFEISIDNENEGIIDEELHSDDDTVFEKRIKKKKNLRDYLKDLEKTIPDINLKQIEFNKIKIINEADLLSKQRRNYKSENVDKNIKDLKKRIEKLKEKLDNIKNKEKIMKEYIGKFKMETGYIYKSGSRISKIGSDFVKQSLIGKINIKNNLDVVPDEEMDSGEVGSDYMNEEEETTEQENNKKNLGDPMNMKKSVMVRPFNFNKKKKNKLKESIHDGVIKNGLKYEMKKKNKKRSKRAKSK